MTEHRDVTRSSISDPALSLHIVDCGGGLVVRVGGEIDLETAPALRSFLTAQLGTLGRGPVVVVDLSGVRFIAIAGVRALLDAQCHATAHGLGFRLASCPRAVRRLLQFIDPDGRLRAYPTVRDALPRHGFGRVPRPRRGS